MAVNRYDVPSQDRYFNTYVPLPYEQLMATVGARQAQQELNQEMLAKQYEDTQNLRYIPGTKDEAYVKDYLNKVNSIVDKFYTADLSDPVVRQQMRREFNTSTDRTKLQNIQTSYANWLTNNKIRQQLIAEGMYSPYLDKDPANSPDFSSDNGVYNYTTRRFESYLPDASRFWSNVKPSLLKDAKGNYLHTPEGYNLTGYDPAAMQKYADLNWGSFDQTPTGRAAIEHELGVRGLENTEVNRKAIATELLMNVRPTGTDLAGSRTPEWASGNKPKWFPTTHAQNIREDKDYDPLGVGKIEFEGDTDEYKIPQGIGVSESSPSMSAGFGLSSSLVTNAAKTEKLKQDNDAVIDFIHKKIPAFAMLGKNATVKAYNQISKDAAAFEDLPKVQLGSDAARKGWAGNLLASTSDRKAQIYDEKQNKLQELRDLNDTRKGSPLEQLGYTPGEFKTELNNFISGKGSNITIGDIAMNGALPGMIIAEVIPKRGDKSPRKLFISSNDQMPNIFAPVQDMYLKLKTFTPGLVDVGGADRDGEVIYVQPDVFKNPLTNEWEYHPKVYGVEIRRDEKGKPIIDPKTKEPAFDIVGEVNHSAIYNKFIDEFLRSNYMGSGTNISTDSY